MMTTEAPTVLLADLVEEWLRREPVRAPSTQARDEWAADLILDHFGRDRSADSITKVEVLEFKELLEQTFTGSTPRIILRLLVRPLERAYREDRISRCVVGGMLLTRRS